jgi:hypothetical protein
MAEMNQLTIGSDTYDLRDTSAVHTVDSALSSSSTNPVQNKVVYQAIEDVKAGPYIEISIALGVFVTFHNFSSTVPTTYSDLISSADFSLAIHKPLIINMFGVGIMAQGLLLDTSGIGNSNHWKILLPDGITFNGAIMNGVEGDLVYYSGDGWALDNFDTSAPGYINYTDTAISNLSIASTQVTASATESAAVATGDAVIFSDTDDSGKLKRMASGFDTSNTTNFLRQDGTWAPPPSSSDTTYTFTGGTQSFTATPSQGTAQSVNIKPQIFKGSCATAAATVNKVVTCPEFTSSDLVAGAVIFVTFTATNSGAVASLTLNVNSTGAKGIKYMRNAAENNLPGVGYLRANMTYRFVYTGTYWVCDTDYDADTVTQLTYRTMRVSTATGGGGLVAYVLCALDANNDVIPFNSTTHASTKTTTYNKALMTASFDPFRGILYYSGSTAVAAGSGRDANEFKSASQFDVRYCLNINSSGTAGSTALTAYDPVYLKALYNTTTRLATLTTNLSSSSYLERSSIVQSLPSSDPNSGLASGTFYIYILLGQAYSKYQLNLYDNNTVYFWNSKAGMMTAFGGIIEANYAPLNHTHSTDDVSISTIAKAGSVTTGDRIIIGTSSLEAPSALAFDTTNTTTFLRKDGTWATPSDSGNTTYTFADGTNSFTVTPSGGTAQTVNVTPSIANNVTGAGLSGYLAKFNGTNTLESGPQLGNGTTTFLRNDGTWQTPPTASHSHGSIDNGGYMTDYDDPVTVSTGDKFLIESEADDGSVSTSNIAIDTTDTNKFLRHDGSWQTISEIKNDLTLLKEGATPGDSQSLIFQRGTLTDSYNDWRIQDRGGFLYFDQRGSGSSSWGNMAYINTSGTLYATTFSGSGSSLTSLNASNISSGTLNAARLPSGLEYTSNKTTGIGPGSTDAQYPSAKAVYDALNSVTILTSDTHYGFSVDSTPATGTLASGTVAQAIGDDLRDLLNSGKSVVIYDDAQIFDFDGNSYSLTFYATLDGGSFVSFRYFKDADGDTRDYELRITTSDTFVIYEVSYGGGGGGGTTYTFTGGTNSFTATPSSGSAQTVDIHPQIFKGVCNSGAGADPKVVACPEFTSADFVKGACIFVTLNYANTASINSVQMNVNGTGAKRIMKLTNGVVSAMDGTEWVQNETFLFTYNGTYWLLNCDKDRIQTNSIGLGYKTIGSTYRYQFMVSCPKDDSNATHVRTLFSVSTANSDYSNMKKSYRTWKFDPFGTFCYYQDTATITNATNGTLVTSSNYQSFRTSCEVVTADYAFNVYRSGTAGTNCFTSGLPVYMKATYNFSDQSAYLWQDISSGNYDGNVPTTMDVSGLTQVLPTTNPNSGSNFFIYIYLGQAHDKHKFSLALDHPVYAWNSAKGAMDLFTGGPMDGDGTCTLTDGMSISFTANYYKVGRQVTVWGTIPKYTSTALGLTGLPYAASATMSSVIQFQQDGSSAARVDATIGVTSGQSTLNTYGYITGSSNSGMFQSNVGTWLNLIPSSGLIFNFTYITATP